MPCGEKVCADGSSLRGKRFRLVSEQEKDRGTGFSRDFWFWPHEKWNESQKMKRGEGEGKEGRFPSFLSHPLLAILLAPFESPSSFFAPKPHRNACYAG